MILPPDHPIAQAQKKNWEEKKREKRIKAKTVQKRKRDKEKVRPRKDHQRRKGDEEKGKRQYRWRV